MLGTVIVIAGGAFALKKGVDAYKSKKLQDEEEIEKKEIEKKERKRRYKIAKKKLQNERERAEYKQNQEWLNKSNQIQDDENYNDLVTNLHNSIDNFDNAVNQEITEEKRAGIKKVLSGIESNLSEITVLYKKSKTKSEKKTALRFQKKLYDIALKKFESQEIAKDDIIKSYLEQINKHFKLVLTPNQKTVRKTPNSSRRK